VATLALFIITVVKMLVYELKSFMCSAEQFSVTTDSFIAAVLVPADGAVV